MSAAELVRMSVLHPRFVRDQRDTRIKQMRKGGASLGSISQAFGISRERVRQIVQEGANE